ncbi:hypothetical protein [Mediterraneibacter faecis]|uniref:hypothetical protein n=1 Tax=Mediterraneibacter faecis TaxID=592978 RepID=UPI003A7F629F
MHQHDRIQHHFNSHPHEEDDFTVVFTVSSGLYFNSHPHEEDDITEKGEITHGNNFNSHPHEEDDSNFKQK